jgi:LuxR family transcriptional regulator, maltose regulon positive regulatory protein
MAASLDETQAQHRANAGRRAAERGLVPRAGLFDRLSSAGPGCVTLVCAPAGSGKSVLIRSWAESRALEDRLAWVSIERGERDNQRFWLTVINALADVADSVERPTPSPTFSGDLIVERLLFELDELEAPVVLVIDDLHELHSSEALELLETFLADLPAQAQVVLTTREDPRLGLHRLRLTGQLTEIRNPDLRFSIDETRELLLAAGIKLSESDIAVLFERTEGWVAGLRLAAISLAHHPDPQRFVREFSGSERTVAGYLLAEVLERQPAEVRELLLRTSVLDRVSGPLADFLTGSSGSERILQELEDANAFVSSLDAGRTWFRYHHLFAELLQLELRRLAPAAVVSLHQAAAEWFEHEQYFVEATRHAQAARDWSHASRLLADNFFDLGLDGRIATVRDLLATFPEDVAAADAELALVRATVRLLSGEHEASTVDVQIAQHMADTVAVERQPRFQMTLEVLRLVVARWRGDFDTVLDAARALDQAVAAQPAVARTASDGHRAVALMNLGIAELWSLRFDGARRHLEQALELSRRAGRPWLEIAPLGHLAIAEPLTGEPLSGGFRRSEEAVRIADTNGWSEDPVIVAPLAAGAMAVLWQAQFDECERWLDRAESVLQPSGEPGTELLVHHVRGLLRLAQRRFDEALDAFHAAALMQTLLAGEHALVIELRSRMLQAQIANGDAAAAHGVLAGTSADERDHGEMRIASAILALAEGEPEQAVDVLGPVIEGTVDSLHPRWPAIEASLWDALAHDRVGDRRASEDSLERALELAEPEGVILPFVLAPVRNLLEALPGHRTAHAALLRTILAVLAGSSVPRGGKLTPLREDLSEAELRVLRYLPSNLKAPEIAAELCVSGNTVRTHLRHIYSKLDAHDRNSAVARARELGLLAAPLRSR